MYGCEACTINKCGRKKIEMNCGIGGESYPIPFISKGTVKK